MAFSHLSVHFTHSNLARRYVCIPSFPCTVIKIHRLCKFKEIESVRLFAVFSKMIEVGKAKFQISNLRYEI
jgi:hypothetical protein